MTDVTAIGGRHRRDPAPPASSGRRVVTVVLGVLCVPAAAAAIVFGVVTPRSGGSSATSLTSPTSEAALAAAKSEIPALLSYDYRSIASDIAKAKADTTGVFAHQYATSAQRLLTQAKQVKAIVQATVGSAGVVSAAPGNVVVLLFVDQATVRQSPGSSTPQTRIDQDRVRATMTNVHGEWLVSALAAQ